MKGIRFYHELEAKGKASERSKGTVIAAIVSEGPHLQYRAIGGNVACYEAFSSLFDESNSPVCFSSVSLDYLQQHTKRISEQRAREIHPRLFERLDE